MENKTLMTDYYEYTMAQTYFDCGMKDTIVYFDIFFRKNPFEVGYTISNGLDEIINLIQMRLRRGGLYQKDTGMSQNPKVRWCNSHGFIIS